MDDCPSTRRHGTIAAYNHDGCRHESARRARRNAENIRQLAILRGQPLTVPAVGASRRIHALYRMGWTTHELGRRLGIPHYRVSVIARQVHPTVLRRTHEKVAALYEEISHLRGPSRFTEGQAKAKGYPPPLAWDEDTIDDPRARPATRLGSHARIEVDPIAVERIWQGEAPARLRRVDSGEFIRQAVERGLTDRQICRYLPMELSAVTARRLRMAKQAAAAVLLQDEPLP